LDSKIYDKYFAEALHCPTMLFKYLFSDTFIFFLFPPLSLSFSIIDSESSSDRCIAARRTEMKLKEMDENKIVLVGRIT